MRRRGEEGGNFSKKKSLILPSTWSSYNFIHAVDKGRRALDGNGRGKKKWIALLKSTEKKASFESSIAVCYWEIFYTMETLTPNTFLIDKEN